MKNKIIIVIYVMILFYIGGCLMEASFNIDSWDKEFRKTLFGISIGICIIGWFMDAFDKATTSNIKQDKSNIKEYKSNINLTK